MRKTISRFTALMLCTGALVGCGGVEQEVEQEQQTLSTVEQGVRTMRADHVVTVTPASGYWGDWKPSVFCEPGAYAIGYRMRVESSQGNGDDTALNSVQLFCSAPPGGLSEFITSYDGLWGSWHPEALCGASGVLTGARVRMEPPQGSGDDTGANDVQFTCSNGGTIAAFGGQGWGDWTGYQTCPLGTAVCGLSIRFENNQGTNADDSAMNGLQLHCCTR
jgi:hypothetical protein